MTSSDQERVIGRRPSVWARRGLAFAVALGGGLALTPPSAAATGGAAVDAAELAALLRELGNPAAAVSPDDAAAAHAEFLRSLGEVQAAVQDCDAFLDRFGSNAGVARVLNQLREKPGRRLFTSPEIVEDLERAVGQPIDLTQFDVELCVQVRDLRVGAKPTGTGAKPATFAAIDTSLRKCLSTLNAIGPNAAGTAVLQGLDRGIGDGTFTSPARLATLERAVGRDIQLTPGELETCVDAYDVHARLEKIFLGDNYPPCTTARTSARAPPARRSAATPPTRSATRSARGKARA